MTDGFTNWYEGVHIFIDTEDDMPQYADHVNDLHISMSFGIYQRYFLEKYGWLIYVKPDYDKFSIHIEHGLKKKVLSRANLINNNINSVQKELVNKAFELESQLSEL